MFRNLNITESDLIRISLKYDYYIKIDNIVEKIDISFETQDLIYDCCDNYRIFDRSAKQLKRMEEIHVQSVKFF